VRYGTVLYRLQQGKSVPDPLPGESRVAAYDYEPDSRPWLRRATGFAGRNPHMAVLVREFSSDTALQAALQRPLNGFVCEYQDSRGIELWRRREPVAFEANFVARVRHDTMVWEYDTTDDPIGVRMVAAAGFRYGGTAADRAQPVP
ncbi:MAG TPA: hypothetical protein PKM88_14240, partial [bacterium]|nr:hypothetical protein [bacterium]